MQNLTDQDLVLLCKDELPYRTRAFEALVERFQDRVFRKAHSMLKNTQDAEDVSQEIFVKVFHGLSGFKMASTFSTWIYTITVNTCLNQIERRKRRPWFSEAREIGDLHADTALDKEVFHIVHNGLERAELREIIDKALEAVGPKSREILRLRFFDELDYESISKRLNIGLSATKMRLKRAREEFTGTAQSLAKSYGYELTS